MDPARRKRGEPPDDPCRGGMEAQRPHGERARAGGKARHPQRRGRIRTRGVPCLAPQLRASRDVAPRRMVVQIQRPGQLPELRRPDPQRRGSRGRSREERPGLPARLFARGVLRPLGVGLSGRQRQRHARGRPQRRAGDGGVLDRNSCAYQQAAGRRPGARRIRNSLDGGVQQDIRRHGLRLGDVGRNPPAPQSLGGAFDRQTRTAATQRYRRRIGRRDRPALHGHVEPRLPAIRGGHLVRPRRAVER